MLSMTNALRNKIKLAIKNRIDISDLIKDIDIKGENLNYAIIKSLNRIHGDISGCSFVRAVIGEDKKETLLSHCNLQHCNFKDATFKGKLIIRCADCRYCSFDSAFVPYVEYQHADLRGIDFCSCSWTLGSKEGHNAKVDKDILQKWGLKVVEE